MNNKRPLTSKTRIQNNKNKNIKNKKNSNTGYITLSDFERIKNTIDPKKEKLIGDWGLGIGDWGLGPIPNPQSPIPNIFRFL